MSQHKIKQVKILLGGLAYVFSCSRIEDCITVIGSDYQICDSLILLNFSFLVSTNACWFHSYLVKPSVYHRMDKSCFNSHRQKNFFSKWCSSVTKFQRNVFLFPSKNIGISNWQLWSSIKYNREKYCWVGWPTCLHVAGSKTVLQCLTETTITVYWSKFLPLVNWTRKTLCRIVENEISLPDICCSNGKIWDKLFENHAHLVQHWDDFFQSLHMSIRQEASITQCKLSKKHLLNFMFLISQNDKWF